MTRASPARPRILFVESYPKALYGQQRTLLALLDTLARMPADAVVAVPGDGDFLDAVRERGLQTLVVPYPTTLASYGGAIYRYRGLNKARMYGQLAVYLAGLRRALAHEDIHAVFCNDLRSLLTVGVAARSLGIPTMIWDKLDKPHGWLDWVQLPLATRNVVIADAIRVKYPGWQQRMFRRRIVKVADGVELGRVDGSPPASPMPPRDSGDVVIGLVGTIGHRKGHDRVLDAWETLQARCPRLRLWIVGQAAGADDLAYAQALACRDHPRVHFLGQRGDAPSVMKAMDMLVAPSRNEGLPLVIAEAMAAGLPVVASTAGGIPEIVEHGRTGLLFDGDDRQALVDAVTRLADSSDERLVMGRAGRQRVEQHFERTALMARVAGMLIELAGGAPTPVNARETPA
jgi:glycosyltransferase involved in cell wall biosynthesis